MADVNDRDGKEEELARKLARLFRKELGQVMDLMGDPPELGNIPPEFWEQQGIDFSQEIRPFIEQIFLEQAGVVLEEVPIGVDWTLINERAAAWASGYTFDLVRDLNDTSRQRLQDAVSRYYRDGLTIGELEQQLTGSFGPVRAEMIAVTEVTRAAARGEDSLVNLLRQEGIEMVTTWNTNVDELVCPKCGPLNGKEAAGRDGSGEPYWIHPSSGVEVRIPAHPRCRCWENNALPEA